MCCISANSDLHGGGLQLPQARVQPVYLLLKLLVSLFQQTSVQPEQLQEAPGCAVVVPAVVLPVALAGQPDAGVSVGHEKTDGLLNGRL